MTRTLRMLRLTAVVGVWISAVAVVPAEAVPITVVQERTFNRVNGWTQITNGEFGAAGWSTNPFPFTQATQISSITLTFTSTDTNYLDGIGPFNGNVWMALGVRDNAFNKVDIASVRHVDPSVTLTAGTGALFTTVRALLLDGHIFVTMGGYEFADGWPGVQNYTLFGTSTMRLTVSGDVPPPPTPVPEPTTLVLLGAGLIGMTRRLRRPTPPR